ncbi:hypothetical protein [Eubacterium barkeri]|uniref:Uncharacterized protein n=1 Tax=Eubacterium barkeri TaxID=1528 RepID=A0A1H3F679_EUBBA|nr:hypothetical protein [Eubacterium barkeri]SDX85694.1 hypothetical protein SAMN04488579_10917 [Eubacterium barkeri]
MKQENYRNRRKINAINTALAANFSYIVIVLIFKGIFDALGLGNTGSYHLIFGGIEFVVVSVFLIAFNWVSFKDASLESNGTYGRFLLLEMIPIGMMTLVTIVLTYVGTNGSFNADWNVATFIVAPTLFWYLPFGIIFNFASMIPLAAFMAICLVYMIGLQFIGFAIGGKSRAFAKEREQKRLVQERQIMQRQNEMARQAAYNTGAISTQAVREGLQSQGGGRRPQTRPAMALDPRDPLGDVDQPAIIQTEAFSSITDEMIEEAVRNQKIKSAQQKSDERRAAAQGQPTVTQQKKNVSISRQRKQQTTDLARELEDIRRKMEKKDEQ